MTVFGFYREAARRSLHRAWELSHFTHVLIGIAAGAVVVAGWQIGEHSLIVVPFLVLLGAFLLGVFWFAYVIYRDEHTALGVAKAELAEARTPATPAHITERERAYREQVGKLNPTERKVLWQIIVSGAMNDDQIAVYCREKGLPEIGGSAIERHVHFLRYDPTTGGRVVAQDVVEMVARILNESAAPP